MQIYKKWITINIKTSIWVRVDFIGIYCISSVYKRPFTNPVNETWGYVRGIMKPFDNQ